MRRGETGGRDGRERGSGVCSVSGLPSPPMKSRLWILARSSSSHPRLSPQPRLPLAAREPQCQSRSMRPFTFRSPRRQVTPLCPLTVTSPHAVPQPRSPLAARAQSPRVTYRPGPKPLPKQTSPPPKPKSQRKNHCIHPRRCASSEANGGKQSRAIHHVTRAIWSSMYGCTTEPTTCRSGAASPLTHSRCGLGAPKTDAFDSRTIIPGEQK